MKIKYYIAVYDCYAGECLVLKEDENTVTVKWLNATTCYNCQKLKKDFYEKEDVIKKDNIAEMHII